jgi:hypothetical protein
MIYQLWNTWFVTSKPCPRINDWHLKLLWTHHGTCHMPKRVKSILNLPADLVWSAACAAYRINGDYFKQAEVTVDGKIVRPANRDLVRQYLAAPGTVTASDVEQGCRCRMVCHVQRDASAFD